MHIFGPTNKGSVNELELRLMSMDTKMTTYVLVSAPFGSPDRDPDRYARSTIIFNDSREIDNLIEMLRRFKEENAAYIGYWK